MDKKKLLANAKRTGNKTFVFSTADVDRDGDRVLQKWDLSDFMKNPIALAFHDHTQPIGTWEDVKVVGGMLQGTLKLAEVGTSAFIDSLHKLIDQDILKSVSVGFRSNSVVENDFGGYDLSDNYLWECSLVSIPANQNALAKEFSYLPEETVKRMCTMDGDCSRSNSKENNSDKIKTKRKGFAMKTYAQRIAALQSTVAAAQEKKATIEAQDEITSDETKTLLDLTNEINSADSQIKQFEALEKAAAGGEVAKVEKKALTVSADEAKSMVVKGLVATAKSQALNLSPVAAAATLYSNEKGVQAMVKAATEPATTTEAEWAGNLVQQGYGAFLETLYPATVYGRVAGRRFEFGQSRSILIPARKADADVSGGFVGEGQPIPVKADGFVTQTLTPKKMAVISTFTAEILKSSTPNVEEIVRTDIVEDTAKAIDTAFLDATAADTGDNPRPAGLQDATATGAGNINASGGADMDAINADIDGVLERMAAVELGQGGTIIMNPARKRGLYSKTNALGQYPFRDGLVEGFEIITSTTVPSDVVYFIDSKAMSFGTDFAPQFEVSTQATLVMADPAEPISTGGATAAGVTELPIRSMFQTQTTALRFILGMDWKITRVGGVQVLTSVAW